MKRRRFVKALTAAPAVPALMAQVPAQNNRPRPTSPAPPPPDATTPPAPLNRTPPAATEMPRLQYSVHDDVGDMQPKFFTAAQYGALRKLSDILMPAINETPGALDARVPEFLDWLISQSPQDRQQFYRVGLDELNGAARKRFSRSFAEVDAKQAAELLAPLSEPWTFEPPADPLARFLRAAKQDVRAATMNSREYTAAAGASGRRGAAGVGLYWLPLD
jgi:hypothetical protein